jgi:hypothetical protein
MRTVMQAFRRTTGNVLATIKQNDTVRTRRVTIPMQKILDVFHRVSAVDNELATITTQHVEHNVNSTDSVGNSKSDYERQNVGRKRTRTWRRTRFSTSCQSETGCGL